MPSRSSTYGPELIGFEATSSLSSWSGCAMAPGKRVMKVGNWPVGRGVVNTTVRSSGVAISTPATRPESGPPLSCMCSMLALTAAESTGVPSESVMLSRRVIVSSVALSFSSNSSAAWGTTVPSASVRNSVSNTAPQSHLTSPALI